MITVKRLRELLAKLPDDAKLCAYEGEDVGLNIYLPDDGYAWIRASQDREAPDDDYIEGIPL